ncbi:MAG: tannase/feruloyl esterase family alpha/beta hydrolase [Neisseria sp.]|uniref:tannase/feruloyl esterase family alpha/beta hydrolase n=1 Tax=Neisseria sp. TaxID=192066 RepID=UPI0026DB9FAF|nr:tannase/feruloyl esterase family alpha/beta hydrolase [Neisseria sp.]MDO4641206.1 tannase/feruloyl esterase family alpha/beta hydrolase [Neisseria sp.]
MNDTVITQADWVAVGPLPKDSAAGLTGASSEIADMNYSAHCMISGEMEKRNGADGKPYHIGFQLRLPENWNKKFLFQGGGGTDGFIAPAVGSVPSHGSTAVPALKRGYAVVSMDGGHQDMTPAFGADQQARINFAYAAIGKVTAVAKQLIETMYHDKLQYSYFMGCSNGGREAMMAAMRYPLEFDGVIAGNPGFRLSKAAMGEAWDSQHFLAAAPKNAQGQRIVANALTQQDLDSLTAGILNRCDAKDGLKDGIVNQWEHCDFKPEMVQDKIGEEKVALLNAVFNGAKNSRGDHIYSGWPYDAGINSPGWRAWKIGTSQTAEPNALNFTLGAGSLPNYFMTPHSPRFSILDFNFDTDPAKTVQVGGINDADSTDLSTFKARGGKMIVFEGVSDPVFSANDLRDWYLQLQQDTANAREAVRLFNIPGMTHCGDGPALDNFDPLTALENWHEKDVAPESMVATGKAFPGKSQPLCAYPKTANYVGGDKNQAASFECR